MIFVISSYIVIGETWLSTTGLLFFCCWILWAYHLSCLFFIYLLLFCLILCISFSWLLVTFGACYFFKTYNLVVVLYYEYLCMVITMRCNFSVHAKTFMVGQKLDYLKSMRVICEKFWNFARKSAVCMFVDLNICCLIFINSYYPCFFGPPCISPLPQNSKRGCVLHWSYTAMRTRCLSGVHITRHHSSQRCAWPWCHARLRASNAMACQQSRQCLLLSHPMS